MFEYKISVVLLGGYWGQLLQQIFRLIIRKVGYSRRTLTYPRADFLCVGIMAVLSITSYLSINPTTHVRLKDAFGIESDLFTWVDWLFTVPSLFYLVETMETRENTLDWISVRVQFAASGSIFALFLTNLSFPLRVSYILFAISNVLMVYACWTLYHKVMKDTTMIRNKYEKAAKVDNDSLEHNLLKIASSKEISAKLLIVICFVYPLLYYIRLMQWVSLDQWLMGVRVLNFCVKSIFCQVIQDCYVDILDSSYFVIQNQRKCSEASRTTFIRYVFHEVREPLNSVVLGLQLLSGSDELRRTCSDVINMMKESTSRMAETLNSYLDLHKLEHHKLELEYQWFDPNLMIQNVIDRFRKELKIGDISITSIIDTGVPNKIYGDQFRLEHALRSLLSGGIDISDSGGEIVIHCSYGTKIKDYVTFCITEYGSTIKDEKRRHVFEVFKNLRDSSASRTSSFGLAICKKIVELHNGVIGFTTSTELEGDDIDREERNFRRSFKRPMSTSFFFSIKASSPEGFPGNDLDRGFNYDDSSEAFNPEDKHPRDHESSEPEALALGSGSHTENSVTFTRLNSLIDHDSEKDEVLERKFAGKGKEPALFDPTEDEDYLVVPFDAYNPEGSRSIPSTASSEMPSTNRFVSIADLKILIVDDVKTNRKMLEVILRREGIEHCTCCEDGLDALELVQEKGMQNFDVIVMDNLMDNMNGVEATGKLRELGYLNLVVGLTGLADEGNEFEKAGADVVLGKPIKIDYLHRLLKFCCNYRVLSGQQPSVKAYIFKQY